MSLLSVEIDPNVRVEGNNTFSSISDIYDGDDTPFCTIDLQEYVQEDSQRSNRATIPVIVFESESEIQGFGEIYKIDWSKGLVYIKVDWGSLR